MISFTPNAFSGNTWHAKEQSIERIGKLSLERPKTAWLHRSDLLVRVEILKLSVFTVLEFIMYAKATALKFVAFVIRKGTLADAQARFIPVLKLAVAAGATPLLGLLKPQWAVDMQYSLSLETRPRRLSSKVRALIGVGCLTALACAVYFRSVTLPKISTVELIVKPSLMNSAVKLMVLLGGFGIASRLTSKKTAKAPCLLDFSTLLPLSIDKIINFEGAGHKNSVFVARVTSNNLESLQEKLEQYCSEFPSSKVCFRQSADRSHTRLNTQELHAGVWIPNSPTPR